MYPSTLFLPNEILPSHFGTKILHALFTSTKYDGLFGINIPPKKNLNIPGPL
jgi:hypothetical protein